MNCIHGRTIYTGKRVIENAYLQFNGTKVVGITKQKRGDLQGECDVITPAFIDAHSHIGMVRAGEPGGESESNDHLDSISAHFDALDSLQTDDVALSEAVEMAVLYSCILPGSGNIIAGLSATIRNYSRNSTQALVRRSGVKGAFGYNPMSAKGWKGQRPSTRMGSMGVLRNRLAQVSQKADEFRRARGKEKSKISFTPEEHVLRDLLTGKQRLRAHVHKIDDIASLLRLADEFKLKLTIEHAMDIHEPEIYGELKKRRVPVVYGPADAFAYKVELKHASWRNVKHLVESGVTYGLMTDHPVTPARQLFFGTRWFTRFGLSKQDAIEVVSRRNAEVLGVDDILGTLERGKWASFACWNGDPFDITSHPQAVYGEGDCLVSA